MAPVHYWATLDGLPDVLLSRWPAALCQLHPFKSWICETPEELAAVREGLARPVPRGPRGELDFAAGPDGALGPARGAAPRDEAVVALYGPPKPSWPWLVLVSSAIATPKAERGRYAWEAFATEAGARERLAVLYDLAASRDRARIVRPRP